MKLRLLVLPLILTAICGAAQADSLWKPASSGSLFTDKKAHQVGDIVTIIVTETSSATHQAATTVTKKDSTTVAPGIGPILRILPKLGFDGSASSAAQGTTSRSNNLNARISAKVIEVKPNGTMVIEGTRDVKTNNDNQITRITGIIRPEDVAPDNTVLSTVIADAKIDYTGKGPISERQKPGIITRLLKKIF
jgi:flagellar L-ring protein precursor FlgH